jgi:hypothetical protein
MNEQCDDLHERDEGVSEYSSEEANRSKLDETIHYLNTLDDEKANRLNSDESGMPTRKHLIGFGDFQNEVTTDAQQEHTDNILGGLKDEISGQETHLFIDPNHVTLETQTNTSAHLTSSANLIP